jgi:hypothetical protein
MELTHLADLERLLNLLQHQGVTSYAGPCGVETVSLTLIPRETLSVAPSPVFEDQGDQEQPQRFDPYQELLGSRTAFPGGK